MAAMRNSTLIGIVVAALVAIAGVYFVWQHFNQLSEQIGTLGAQVDDLGQQVTTAKERATEAEARAEEARRESDAAAQAAQAAATREQQTAEEARAAAEARQAAEERERKATTAQQQAEQRARKEAQARAMAEAQREAADKERTEANRRADEARAEAIEATLQAERLRSRMTAELDRLQGALGRIADTRRTALGLVMTLDSKQIEFDFDKATLRPENREILSRIAGVLLTFDNYGVQIFGHTDDVGSDEYNEQLSEQRAETVRHYLVEAGIAPDVLSITGLGKSSPLVKGTDPESRQRNRRVELAIVFSEGDYEPVKEDE